MAVDRLRSAGPSGVSPLTTAERDALTAGQLWTGRLIYNTTTQQHETWNGTAWVAAGGSGGGWARTFMMMG